MNYMSYLCVEKWLGKKTEAVGSVIIERNMEQLTTGFDHTNLSWQGNQQQS